MVPGTLLSLYGSEDSISYRMGHPFPEEQANIQSFPRPSGQTRTFIRKKHNLLKCGSGRIFSFIAFIPVSAIANANSQQYPSDTTYYINL